MPERIADLVIIGGAAVGSAIAYFLKRSGFRGRLVVIEKDPSYQWCASGRAVAGIRQQFSTPVNVAASLYGIDFLRRAGDLLAVDGADGDGGADRPGGCRAGRHRRRIAGAHPRHLRDAARRADAEILIQGSARLNRVVRASD